MIAAWGVQTSWNRLPQGPIATQQGAWHQRIDDNPLTAQIPGFSHRKIRLGPTFHTVWNVKETDGPARNGDILGYARVSTAAQDAASQQDRLREAGAIRVFVDVISGRRFQRPALAELIDHARPGDRLSVTRLDRLGRSLKELLDTVESLKVRSIHLVRLEERIDTTSAAGELVFHVFGAIAHFERRLISERTRDGIAAAKRRGKRPGRLPLHPDTVSAAQKLIEAGLTPGEAAKRLGIGRATAYRIARALY